MADYDHRTVSAGSNKVFPNDEESVFHHTVAGNPRKPPTDESKMVAAGSNIPPQHNRFVTQMGPNGRPIRIFDFNFHAMKKSVSSGLLDVALLLANSSQLKHVILHGKENQFYEALIVLLSLSIFFQILIGCVLIFLSRININEADEHRHRQAEILNNFVVVGIFILTVLNVFIGALGISASDQDPI